MAGDELFDGLTLSLAEVALLARVKRPVVTTWRRRSAASDTPFPSPVQIDTRGQRFDAEQVVTWLEVTGHGKNASAREDAAAFADLGDGLLRDDEHVVHGVTALLCLGVLSGERVGELDADELLDLADESDPDDDFLYTEIDALGERLPPVARYADLLADAAFTPAEAFETVLRSFRRGGPPVDGAEALADTARALVAHLAVALAQDAQLSIPTFVDPTRGGGGLLIPAVDELGEDRSVTVLTSDHDDPLSRMARRRLRVHGVVRHAVPVADDGAYEVVQPAVHVARFPAPASPGMSTDEILTAIDNIVLNISDAHRAVVIAPAGVVIRSLSSARSDQLRTDVLRSGHVRAIVLLPDGLVASKPRQQLALWVLGPAHRDVSLADRWTTVADLTNETLTPATIDDLITDIIAALGNRTTVHAHAFRFGRVVPTRLLLAVTDDLVRPVPGPVHVDGVSAAEVALRIATLDEVISSMALASPLSSHRVEVAKADRPLRAQAVTLGQAASSKQVRLVPGNRIDPSDIGTGDGADVIGPDELTGAIEQGSRRIPRLTFAAKYEAGRYTEPGDVVFCTSPRVAAMVDVDGALVVVYPARALRIADAGAGFDPYVLAQDINALTASAKSWRSWQVRRVPRDQGDVLSGVMRRINEEREAAGRRVAHLDELASLLARGVTDGSLIIERTDELEGS